MEKINLQTDAQEFLFYSYFGKTWDSLKCKKESNNEEGAIYVCFQRAYRDFCRTLSFKKKDGDFPHDVYYMGYMGKNNDDWLGSKLLRILDSKGDTEFNSQHDEICGMILANAKGVGHLAVGDDGDAIFYYGQAQKWLNMTLKYMRMTGLWKDEFSKSKIDSFLHIPLDRIILKALSNGDIRTYIDEGLIKKDNVLSCVNSEGAIRFTKCNGSFTENSELCEVGKKGMNADYVTWSKIPYYEMYIKVQEAVKACIPDDPKPGEKSMSPLDWENKVWLAASLRLGQEIDP